MSKAKSSNAAKETTTNQVPESPTPENETVPVPIVEAARDVARKEADLKRVERGNKRRSVIAQAEATGDFDSPDVKRLMRKAASPGWLTDMQDVAFLSRHFQTVRNPGHRVIQERLVSELRKQVGTKVKTGAVVIPNYRYAGQTLDVIAIYKNRIVEFVVITNVDGLLREMRKILVFGPQKVNKHHWLSQGKLNQSQLYLVVPAGFIQDMKGAAPHLGIMVAEYTEKDTAGMTFKMVREAHACHDKPISAETFRDALFEMYDRGLSLLSHIPVTSVAQQTWEGP